MDTSTSTSLRFAVLVTAAGGFLDAYTYISRDGVFANAQTANVIFLAVDAAGGNWHSARAHLWPILAFIVGVALANLLKSDRVGRTVAHPIRWAIVAQILVLVAVGFVPHSVNNAVVTVPIAFVAAIQMGLFRTVGSLAYITIATTGNLMRFTEALYACLIDRSNESRRSAGIYGAIVSCFALGAVVGAVGTKAFEGQAAWIPAAVLGATLVLFYIDERKGTEP